MIAALALTAALVLLGGCDTIGQDLGDVSAVLKPTTPHEAIIMMVDPYNADNRRIGTVLISNAPWGGTEVYLKQYRDMVEHERDPIVKAVAIRALAKHGTPEDALKILPHLTDANVQVRWEAAKGLQRLHNPAAVPDLLKTLSNSGEDADVRVAAAVALGQYPEDRAFQGLIAALDARELAVNTAAEQSLNILTGQSLGLDAPSWLNWYNGIGGAAEAFNQHGEYLYPTYARDKTMWERLAFWTSHDFEQPAPPAGLKPKTERSTYGDEPAAHDTGE